MKKISILPNKIDYSLVQEAAKYLLDGKIVALPTDTVYGLACCYNNPKAVDNLYALKERDKNKPFTLAMDDPQKAINDYFSTMPPFGYKLMEKFWPGALTIVYYSKEDSKIGIRVPDHKVTLQILEELGIPVYLPSANINNQPEAINAKQVEDIFDDKIDLIVDGGEALYNKSSTVIDLTSHPFNVLREGVINQRDLIEEFVKKRILFVCTGNTCRSPLAQYLLHKFIYQERPYLRPRYEILSCGIQALEGVPIANEVIKILREKEDMDVEGAESWPLNRNILRSSDLIFTMQDSQYDYILNYEPTVEGRLFTLKQFLPQDMAQDIPDPIGKDASFYEEVYGLIRTAVKEILEWL